MNREMEKFRAARLQLITHNVSYLERLKDDEDGAKIFHNTLVGNINKAIDAAETLNVEDDDELKRLTTMVKDIFDGISADDLRRDADLRRNTAAKAEEIASKISELF